jgi:hypothetical protein
MLQRPQEKGLHQGGLKEQVNLYFLSAALRTGAALSAK